MAERIPVSLKLSTFRRLVRVINYLRLINGKGDRVIFFAVGPDLTVLSIQECTIQSPRTGSTVNHFQPCALEGVRSFISQALERYDVTHSRDLDATSPLATTAIFAQDQWEDGQAHKKR